MPGHIMGADPKNSQLIASVRLGVKWMKNNSPTTLTRLHDAVGLNFTPAVGGVGGSSDFDSLPIYKDIKLCNMQNGAVTAYQGEPGFTRTPVAGVDVMVEIPKFYFKITDSANERDFEISDRQIDGFLPSPRHAPHTGFPGGHDVIYVSAYTVNSVYQSKSGNQSLVNITRAQARTGCAGRGTNYSQYDFATLMTLWLLYIVETANWDSQAAVGAGYTDGGNPDQINTGDADGVAFHSGSMAAAGIATRAAKYRHMENLWGNLYQWVDGINFNNQTAYVNVNPSSFADDVGPTAAYIQVPYTLPTNGSGWIKGLGYNSDMPWAMIPNLFGGASGQFLSDYGYVGYSGWRVLSVGGYWYDVTSAGLFFFFANIDSAYSYDSIGARLLVLP